METKKHLDRFWKYCMIRKIAFQGPTFVGPFFRTSPPAERRITMLKKKESVIIKFDFSAEQTVGDITKIVGLTMAKYRKSQE